MNQDIFAKCIKVLKTSSSDNEILAALLAVTKILKNDECNLDTVREIFQAVGVRFLKRLLKTGGTSADCPNLSFKSVAVSILSCFCAVKGFVAEFHTELSHLLPDLVKITNIKEESIDDADTGQTLLSDCYDCLSCVVSDAEGRQTFINSGCVSDVCQAVNNKYYGHEKGLQLVLFLCQSSSHQLWKNCEEQYTTLVNSFVSKLEVDKTDETFEICRILSFLIGSACMEDVDRLNAGDTLSRLHKVLFLLLKNKLGWEQRCTVLRLCTVSTERFGVPWALSSGEGGPKFLLLMVHLSCIEVRMNLDTENKDKIVACSSHLGSCYSLLELVIEYMTSGPSMQLEDKQVAQLHSAMVGAFNSVIQFLDEMSCEEVTKELRPLVIASVRVLGSWIAEETTALREEVLKILPFLIETGRDTFHQSLNAESEGCRIPSDKRVDATSSHNSSHSPPDMNGRAEELVACASKSELVEHGNTNDTSDRKDEKMDQAPSQSKGTANISSTSLVSTEILAREFYDVDVLQFLMPGLCHLSAEDSARKILLNSDLTHLLYDYLVHQWRKIRSSAKGADNNNLGKEPMVVMTTTCGVVLNIIVLEADLVGTSSLFEEMFNFVAGCLSSLSGSGDEWLTLQYNIMLIGLMIIRRRVENQDFGQARMDDFFSDSIKLLRQAHVAPSSKKGTNSSLECPACWPDFAELWYLAMQVICECAQYLDWLPKTILASKWLPRVCKMLQDVKDQSVPEDIASTYLDLFFTFASRSETVCKVLRDSNCMKITRKYRTDVSKQLEEMLL